MCLYFPKFPLYLCASLSLIRRKCNKYFNSPWDCFHSYPGLLSKPISVSQAGNPEDQSLPLLRILLPWALQWEWLSRKPVQCFWILSARDRKENDPGAPGPSLPLPVPSREAETKAQSFWFSPHLGANFLHPAQGHHFRTVSDGTWTPWPSHQNDTPPRCHFLWAQKSAEGKWNSWAMTPGNIRRRYHP